MDNSKPRFSTHIQPSKLSAFFQHNQQVWYSATNTFHILRLLFSVINSSVPVDRLAIDALPQGSLSSPSVRDRLSAKPHAIVASYNVVSIHSSHSKNHHIIILGSSASTCTYGYRGIEERKCTYPRSLYPSCLLPCGLENCCVLAKEHVNRGSASNYDDHSIESIAAHWGMRLCGCGSPYLTLFVFSPKT